MNSPSKEMQEATLRVLLDPSAALKGIIEESEQKLQQKKEEIEQILQQKKEEIHKELVQKMNEEKRTINS